VTERAAAPSPGQAGPPPRQRWRLYLRVPPSPPNPSGHAATGGEPVAGAGAWLAVLSRSGLPLAGSGGPRGRVTPAAQLPAGVGGEREVVDVTLAERLPQAEVREAVAGALPSAISLVDLHDVWVGGPAAPAAVVAADYRLELTGCDEQWVARAADALLRRATLPRVRAREKRTTEYDLRPLILGIEVAGPPPGGPPGGTVVRVRLRHDADGVGRPDELVAALLEPSAEPDAAALLPPPPPGCGCRSIVRERLILGDDEETQLTRP
jgi:radical SAM-linked protein